MQTNVDGIGRFVQSLGSIFGGGQNALDMARAGLLGSQQGLVDQQILQQESANRARAEQALGVQSVKFGQNPESMRGPIAQSFYMDNPRASIQGVQAGGLAINPNMYGGSGPLSNALLGTGMVGAYSSTPAGYEANLANNLDQQRLANEGALAVAQARGVDGLDPLKVTPGQVGDFRGMAEEMLLSQIAANPAWKNVTGSQISPALYDQATSDAISGFNAGPNRGNPQAATLAAVQQILNDPNKVQYQKPGDDPWYLPNFLFGEASPGYLGDPSMAPEKYDQQIPEQVYPFLGPAAHLSRLAYRTGGELLNELMGGAAEGIGNPNAAPTSAAPAPVDPGLAQVEGKPVTLKDGSKGVIRNGHFYPNPG